jgi:hypothetical protein
MTVMKKLADILRSLLVHSMIFSLIQTSFVFSSYAQDNSTAKNILGVAQAALGTFAQVQNQKIQSQMMIAQQQKNAQLMQSLSPNCRKADGTSCHTIAGKFFPECPLPSTISAMPHNVCSETNPDINQSAMQISSMQNYEQISQTWVDYYTQMENTASNATVPFGLKCLEDKHKALDSQLIEMQNNLSRLQTQISKEIEAAKAGNKKLLEELTTTNDELLGAGGSGKNNLKLKSQDFTRLFSASCQSVIGDENLANAPQMGLLGVMQSLTPANKRAADYNTNRNSIETEVRNDISKIQRSIKDGGLQNYFDGKITETSKYKSLVSATQKQAAEFKIAKDRIAGELAKLNYEIPTMDKNFEVDFSTFISVAKNHFKQQYVKDCVTGADKTGIAIPLDKILASLNQRSTKGTSSTATSKYRTSLANIMAKDSDLSSKLEEIKALEANYKDITITRQNSTGQRITETPYDFYMQTLEKCEANYVQNSQSNAAGSNGISYKKRVERGEALLRELQTLHTNYASNLGTKVLEQVLTCNGESKKAGSSCGNPESFDHTSASFCMSHANICANEVNGCYAEANKHVEVRKAKMEALAKNFNSNAAKIVERSNQLYTAQTTAVMELVKVVQARFPGTNFPIPANMFISMPEMKKDSFGIELANDGNMNFMDELPKKLEILKTMFKDQQAKVDDEITDYIGKQTQAMSTQKERWEQLAQECKSMANSIRKDIAKANAEGMKKQAEQDAQVGSFCNKYSLMKQNPLGACDDAKSLAESMDKVQARLTNETIKYTQSFRNVCNQYNNDSTDTVLNNCWDYESNKDLTTQQKKSCALATAKFNKANPETAKKKSRLNLNTFCSKNGSVNNDKEFIAAAASKLSSEDQETLKKVTTIEDLRKKLDSLDDSASDFFSGLLSLGKNNEICKTLTKIDSDDATSDKTTAELKKETALEKNKQVKFEKELASLKDKIEKETNADEKKKLSDAETKARKDLEDSKDSIALNEKSLNKAALKDAIDSLVPAPPSMTDIREKELRRIGEQASDSACDAQASNVNQGKNLGSSFLDSINQLDKSILGSAK